ncbi:4Fe-4S single cluster domain-containing protein [Micromonospora sp. NPDC006766]|uniref:4Fe-4S single cluster domain-containing protein n=1 Tax=Micromonospora sp. NPDC006766 TaxID=3154778 RepID=UPI0033DACB15
MALSASVPWRIHATLPRSRANGPGERFVVWTQGCSLGCAGCFNPETHPAGSVAREVANVVREVLATPGIEGVTVTGGEPLEQPEALAAFVAGVRRAGLGVVVLTGFSRAEIATDPALTAAVAGVDLVIAGRYNRRLHLGAGLRGSSNKEYWDRTGRYSAAMLSAVPEVEVLIGRDGTVTVTGMVAAPGGGGQ